MLLRCTIRKNCRRLICHGNGLRLTDAPDKDVARMIVGKKAIAIDQRPLTKSENAKDS